MGDPLRRRRAAPARVSAMDVERAGTSRRIAPARAVPESRQAAADTLAPAAAQRRRARPPERAGSLGANVVRSGPGDRRAYRCRRQAPMAPARRARRLRQTAGAQQRRYARQWPERIAMSILSRFENILLDGVPSRFAVVGGAGETMPAIRARIASCGASVRSWAGATGPVGNAAL